MKKSRKKRTTKIIRLLIVNAFLVSILFLGLGYSLLSSNLNIFGDVQLKKYEEPTLYNALQKLAKEGTYAKEYTGVHQDSINSSLSTKKIYYWYAPNTTVGNSRANAILNMNNVIFGGFCWQMIRTTDTGGIKIIYNGLPNSGSCNNTGNNQQIGTSKYNDDNKSPADLGYMYNDRYTYNIKSQSSITIYTQTSMNGSTSYYYGTGVTYDTSTGKYNLTNVSQSTWSSKYSSAAGLYTCKSSTATSCSSVYYIARGVSTYFWGFVMNNGNLLNYYNTNIVYGSSYTENNGTYTLNNTSSFTKADWYNNRSNIDKKYICSTMSTNTCGEIWYVTSARVSDMNYISSANPYKYANDFTYNNGIYTLNNDSVTIWDLGKTSNLTSINNHHYTCFNLTGECSSLAYIYSINTYTNSHYINLNGGKGAEDALEDMLNGDNVNTTNSTIKSYIDTWYQNNLVSYTDKLEDIIFCNDRSISNIGGFNPNGGIVSGINSHLFFKSYDTIGNLSCENTTDRFSLTNSKAQLTYPVGLLTVGERDLLYNNIIFSTGSSYYLMSPSSFGETEARIFHIYSYNDSRTDSNVNVSLGVRPVVSLKPGTEFVSGDGSKDNPYIVDMD